MLDLTNHLLNKTGPRANLFSLYFGLRECKLNSSLASAAATSRRTLGAVADLHSELRKERLFFNE